MAPCNGTTSTQPQHTTMAPCNGTQLWHHVHSPNVKVGRHPPPQPQHTTVAPCNGTTSIPPKLKLVVTLRPNHSTLQWYPTMAPSNGTTSIAPCNGTLVPRPIRQSGSSPSLPLGVRTPIAIAIWGKIREGNKINTRKCLENVKHAFPCFSKLGG